MRDPIRFLSENPLEQIWTNLSSYESKKLAKKLIKSRAESIGRDVSEELLNAKAVGLAYCLRNAREYLREPPQEWNKRILGTYYGIMSIIGAQLIADPATTYDLLGFEATTKQGHGLGNDDTDEGFPIGQKIFVSGDGLFVKYLGYPEGLTDFMRTPETQKSSRATPQLLSQPSHPTVFAYPTAQGDHHRPKQPAQKKLYQP